MKNSADLGGCYPPRPSASVDNMLLDLQYSSYPTQPHSIIEAKCSDLAIETMMYILLCYYVLSCISISLQRKNELIKKDRRFLWQKG